jgi:hypothetical protein
MKNTEDFPLITIITPTYNSAHTLADTLESIAAQDYPHIEHIIVDGLSKDDTLAIAGRFPHVSKIMSEKLMDRISLFGHMTRSRRALYSYLR